MASSVVRIDDETHAKLREIAKAQHQPVGKIVTRLVREYERQQFWKEVNESVDRLRADPVAWKVYKEEVAFFEGGSMDGLENEAPYFTPEEEAEIYADAERTEGG